MRLVVQGTEIDTRTLKELAGLTGATGIQRRASTAFEITGASTAAAVGPCCESRGLDWAFVPDGLHLEDFRLIALDMDATLIDCECLDELADSMGLRERIAPLTAGAMRGEINFETSYRGRLRLLTGVDEARMARVWTERAHLNPGAEKLLAACRQAGLQTALVTGGALFFARRLAERLDIDHVVASHWRMRDGVFTGELEGELIDGPAKARHVARLATALGAGVQQTLCVGDGANDIPMLAQAGASIAWHARPRVRAAARFCIDHVGLDGILHLLPPRPAADLDADDDLSAY